MKIRWMIGLALLAACGGSTSTGGVAPASTPRASVDEFMEAVADSNLAKMAMLWGTAKGPAAVTGEPSDYERRMVVMHAFLRGVDHTVTNEYAGPGGDQRIVDVHMTRGNCAVTVPVTTVRTGGHGWIVNAIDVSLVGAPGRDCGGGADSAAGPQG